MSNKKIALETPPALGNAAGSPDLAADDGLFWETRVADSLGVSRDRLRAIREAHMQENTHFIRRRNAVVLTASGLDLLHTQLATAPASAPAAPASEKILLTIPGSVIPTPVPAGPAPRLQVRVVKVPPNARLLFCIRANTPADQTPPPFLVRVKTNVNFMAGMQLEVISAGENFWQHIGRLPRRKGRW